MPSFSQYFFQLNGLAIDCLLYICIFIIVVAPHFPKALDVHTIATHFQNTGTLYFVFVILPDFVVQAATHLDCVMLTYSAYCKWFMGAMDFKRRRLEGRRHSKMRMPDERSGTDVDIATLQKQIVVGELHSVNGGSLEPTQDDKERMVEVEENYEYDMIRKMTAQAIENEKKFCAHIVGNKSFNEDPGKIFVRMSISQIDARLEELRARK